MSTTRPRNNHSLPGGRSGKAITAMTAAIVAGTVLAGHSAPGHAPEQPAVTLAAYSETTGGHALDWAETQDGSPYSWGGSGPYGAGYDCSGLVVAAFAREGIRLPRTTWGMLGSGMLTQVSFPQRGDLVFLYYGEHVEFATVWPYTTFGEHSGGSTAGWLDWGWSGTWPPGTTFYRVT